VIYFFEKVFITALAEDFLHCRCKVKALTLYTRTQNFKSCLQLQSNGREKNKFRQLEEPNIHEEIAHLAFVLNIPQRPRLNSKAIRFAENGKVFN